MGSITIIIVVFILGTVITVTVIKAIKSVLVIVRWEVALCVYLYFGPIFQIIAIVIISIAFDLDILVPEKGTKIKTARQFY